MWTRYDLKMRAKQAFQRNYWAYVGVAFVMSIVATAFGSNVMARGRSSVTQSYYDYDTGFTHSYTEYISDIPLIGMLAGTIALMISIFTALFGVFVGNVLAVGGNRFFVLNQTERAGAGNLLSAFKSGHYANVVLTMFLRDIFTFLWSMLFIIPGVIKYYEYLMVPYILSENPGMNRREAFQISKRMMTGQKMEAFLLSLSFIGWNLLSIITCGLVGIFYVNPYMEATFAELYSVNRQKAFSEGYIR